MTSKNSFWKLSNWNFKKRGWTLALCSVIWFFMLPAALFVNAGSLLQNLENLSGAERQTELSWIRNEIINYVISGDDIAIFAVVGMALLLALQGFVWNNDQRKVDLYKSVPVKEATRFWYINFNSLWIFCVSLGANMLLANAVAAARGIWGRDVAAASLFSFGMDTLLFVSAYLLVLIAESLTGNIVLAFCGAAVLLALEPVTLLLRDGLMETFYQTYYTENLYRTVGDGILTPLSVFIRMYTGITEKDSGFADPANLSGAWGYVVIFLIQIAVYGAIAYFLYRRRPAQSGGKAMIFSKTKPIIKVAVMIVGSLYIAYLMAYPVGGDYAIWYGLFGLICGLLVLQVVLQSIMEGNFKEALGGKCSFAAAVGIALIIYFVYACDLTGYDRYLPEAGEVESFAFVRSNDFYYNYYDEDGVYQGSDDYLRKKMEITDPQLVEELLSMLEQAIADDDYYWQDIADSETAASSQEKETVYEDGNDQENIYVTFRLDGGKEVRRHYVLRLDAIRSYWVKLYEQSEYKQAIYMLLQEQSEEWISGKDTKTSVYYHTYNLSTEGCSSKEKALTTELYEAMKQDAKNRSAETVMTQAPVGKIEFYAEWDTEWGTRSVSLPMAVYEEDAATIALLKSEGWYQEAGIGGDEVAYLNVYQYTDDGAQEKILRLTEEDALFETVREQVVLLDAVVELPDSGALCKANYRVEIGLKGASNDEYGSYWYDGYLYLSGFPEELATIFEGMEAESDEED